MASGADLIIQDPLPYPENGLSPYISSTTLSYHYGKHHKTYVEKTNGLIKGSDLEGLSLRNIILRAAKRAEMKTLFNNAAQAWNHSFYWESMKPNGGGKPGKDLLELIKSSFGSFEDFKKQFESDATSYFGSGWIWLVQRSGQLKITATHDADNPLTGQDKPLITLDVWEHAYYLDYQNRRAEYVKVFLERLVNWTFAENNLQSGR